MTVTINTNGIESEGDIKTIEFGLLQSNLWFIPHLEEALQSVRDQVTTWSDPTQPKSTSLTIKIETPSNPLLERKADTLGELATEDSDEDDTQFKPTARELERFQSLFSLGADADVECVIPVYLARVIPVLGKL